MQAKSIGSALILGAVLLSITGCYGAGRARSAEVEAAQIVYTAAGGSGSFNPCRPYPDMRICRPGESPTDNTLDFCMKASCEGGHVVTLDLSYRQLNVLPPEVAQLTYLQALDLSNNQLTSLPPEIGQMTHLQALDLSSNQLTSLPPEIGMLQELESLNISDNQLSGLPAEVSQLAALRSLNVSNNQLNEVPAEITQLTHLTALALTGNPMTGPIPAALTSLPLNYFYFQRTDLCIPTDDQMQRWLMSIETVDLLSPEAICALREDQHAVLLTLYELTGGPEGWSVDTFPCDWTGVGCTWTGHVNVLVMPGANLRELPPEIGALTELEWLNLGSNELTSLPSEIGHLTNLRVLYLDGNRLESLPPEIGELRKLEDLFLFENNLTELPPELGRLTRLRRLDISHNPLSGPLPASLTGIPPESLIMIFEDTELCIPENSDIAAWITRLNALDEVQVRWLLENRGCNQ